MKRAESRNLHFRARTGSSSTRSYSHGDSEFGDIALQPSVAAQLEAFLSGKGTDEEFKRQGGHFRALLANEQRKDFEAIFLHVANARLPKNAFLALAEEARSIWRGQYRSIAPPDFKHMKKLRNLRRKTAGEAE